MCVGYVLPDEREQPWRFVLSFVGEGGGGLEVHLPTDALRWVAMAIVVGAGRRRAGDECSRWASGQLARVLTRAADSGAGLGGWLYARLFGCGNDMIAMLSSLSFELGPPCCAVRPPGNRRSTNGGAA